MTISPLACHGLPGDAARMADEESKITCKQCGGAGGYHDPKTGMYIYCPRCGGSGDEP